MCRKRLERLRQLRSALDAAWSRTTLVARRPAALWLRRDEVAAGFAQGR